MKKGRCPPSWSQSRATLERGSGGNAPIYFRKKGLAVPQIQTQSAIGGEFGTSARGHAKGKGLLALAKQS